MASKNETTPLMGGGDGHKRSDSQPSYYFLQRTASLQRTESAMKKEGGEVVELPPEGASSAEFNSRPVAVRFPCFGWLGRMWWLEFADERKANIHT